MFERFRLKFGICVTEEERDLYGRLFGLYILLSEDRGHMHRLGYSLYLDKLKLRVERDGSRFKPYFEDLVNRLS